MNRAPLIPFAVLSACSQSPGEDLRYVKQARSIGAEWALVNEQAQSGLVTIVYAQSMHRWLRENLRTASSGIRQHNSNYGAEMRGLLAEPADARPDRLRSHSKALKRIEHNLESD